MSYDSCYGVTAATFLFPSSFSSSFFSASVRFFFFTFGLKPRRFTAVFMCLLGVGLGSGSGGME